MPCMLAMMISDVGDAMTLVGATFYPMIGFITPLIIFLKLQEKRPLMDREKLSTIIVMVTMIIITTMMSIFVVKSMYYKKENDIDPLTC